MERVFLGMSGGVDSSVAAILLKKAGYDVVGYTFRVFDSMSEDCIKRQKGCCTVESIYAAKEIAEKLGIEHHILDLRADFASSVILNFTETYIAGRTPNPCVECNRQIKWGLIRSIADKNNCKYLATGHYAAIKTNEKNSFLSSATDKEKDQTYFLWQIPRGLLTTTIFPLGDLNKTRVREIAHEWGFEKVSEKADSQEICFIPGDDYRAFLTEHSQELPGKGKFIDTTGKILGMHNGYPFYTVGQRKGLGIAMGERMYVIEIKPETNEVILGLPDDLLSNSMIVSSVNPGKSDFPEKGKTYNVKVRYRSKSEEARVEDISGNNVLIAFKEPVSAVTPGQSAVFYDEENDVSFGAVIEKSIK